MNDPPKNLPDCPYCQHFDENPFAEAHVHRNEETKRYRIFCGNCGPITMEYDTSVEAVEVFRKHAGPLAKMNMGVPG